MEHQFFKENSLINEQLREELSISVAGSLHPVYHNFVFWEAC